ncbi:LuxR C-terminal-related transcriptional regulator [Pseudomonas jinjuensis]|uniref:LuxR family transcriptional regulator, maltose regulon positive regulatory protein n=1 Tax=Pseudomonas jinjuensis TaxID=198616 RepID=A0A1H0BRB5_9PSED|nr:LuxR C-terminal-related transcriptional regulator [Pseudomonas jinjuensis]SDN48170.1 LuxR family transcriptional regulator, maltose regulon positive regulatory protein [Pseudomonas jinjuensis]
MPDFSMPGIPCPDRELQLVASTKVIPPRGARHLMPRDALIARLQEARRQRCVVIQGPAGCGKTSTLLAWRRELLALNFDVAWLSLTGEDNELTRFSHCLLASLAEVDPAMVREAAILTGRENDDLALEHWVITLVQGLAQRQQQLVLMLDDVHHLADRRNLLILQWLLDYAPAQFHLVLGSRAALPMPHTLTRLRTQGLLAEFDLRDLRFSLEESERFLREQLGRIERRDVEVLHELTDGWAAGLQLFAVDLKARHGASYPHVQVRDPGAFASYFEHEVLAHLAPEDLDLLLRASICNRFCSSLCAALTGQPYAQPRVLNRLARLDSENMFITRIESHERDVWYRLHPLLREALRNQLAGHPEIDQKALHAAARGWFSGRGHVDEAVHHAIQAGDVQAAADIVEACAIELLARGDLGQLPGLLRRLPPEQLQQRFALQLVMAHIHLYTRNFGAFGQSLAQLESTRERLDPCQRYHLTLLRGSMAMLRDDSAAAQAILPELLDIPEDADDYLQTGRSNVLAWLYMYQGEYEYARDILDAGERPGGSPRRSLIGRCVGGISLIIEGRITQAEHIFREVLEEAEQQGPSYGAVAFMAAGLLASVLYELNECESARTLLEPRIGVLERAAMPDSVLQALLVLALSHWLAGRRLEAHAQLDRLEEYASNYQLDRLLVTSLMTRQGWLRQEGQGEQAEAILREVEALAARYPDVAQGTEGEIRTFGKRAQIELCLLNKDFAGAATLLSPLIDAAEASRRWRRAATLRLQLALVEHARGNPGESRMQLIEALRLGHRLGLLRTLLSLSSRLPKLLAELLAENCLDPVLGFYVQRLLAVAAGPEHDAGASQEPAALGTLSEREGEVLALLAHAMPNKKIARALNVSPETVKWHLKNIYVKLGVSGRDEAIARMRDLSSG